MPLAVHNAPIGVFDSGIGGLTIYRALRAYLPHENFVYFGDTAHLPYGTKSAAEVESLTLNAVAFLRGHGIKFLCVACNTVSAQALVAVQATFPDLPYIGIIAVGAEAAIKATRNGRIAVLATEGTVRSGVYGAMLRGLRRDIDVQMLACGDLVPLVEAGCWQGPVVEAAVARYLDMLKKGYDTLVLGCTHFPILAELFRSLCPPQVQIIDSALVTAQTVAGLLAARGMLNEQAVGGQSAFWVTAGAEPFAAVAARFLGKGLVVRRVKKRLR